jgi:hypothetical protein
MVAGAKRGNGTDSRDVGRLTEEAKNRGGDHYCALSRSRTETLCKRSPNSRLNISKG